MSRLGTAVILLFVIAFIAVCVALFTRDNLAVERCHDRGGETWDDGQHCVIGSGYEVVSTR